MVVRTVLIALCISFGLLSAGLAASHALDGYLVSVLWVLAALMWSGLGVIQVVIAKSV